jgi:hypothetical protein
MLSAEETQLVRASVREIAHAVDRLTRTAVNEPAPTSKARSYATSESNLRSFDGVHGIVEEAYFSVLLATSSGVDHVKAFTATLGGGHGTVALGTLVRSAVEAFAKSHHLLSAKTSEDLIGRHIALTAHELTFPLRYSRFQQGDGTITDGQSYPKLHRAIAHELGLPPIQVPSVQSRVSSLLTAGSTGLDVDGDVYSGLSGAAHAVTSALGMYMLRDGTARYEYPRAIAFEQVGYLFVGIAVVAELVIDVFQPAQANRDRWMGARQRAEAALRQIADAVERGDGT